nr:MAG TPA: hypothetical protein [Caudoviricetes sp.]
MLQLQIIVSIMSQAFRPLTRHLYLSNMVRSITALIIKD